MRASILKKLLQAHISGDGQAFRRAALALAAAESDAGHIRVAEEVRKLIAEMPTVPKGAGIVTDIARPRGELADILEGGHRSERWHDIVLTEPATTTLKRIVQEIRARARLERYSVAPRRHVLFFGPPGCGKTLGAAVLAGELAIPLMTIRVASLFSRFLGATSNHLREVFAEMPRRPAVYLFDEFDSIAKARRDSQDVGEMRRIVTSFLQLMDTDQSTSLVIAATNHADLLDHAVFRRFDVHVEFGLPDRVQARRLLDLRLSSLQLPSVWLDDLAEKTEGLSYSEIATACDDAIRSMALEERNAPTLQELETALEATRRRHRATTGSPRLDA